MPDTKNIEAAVLLCKDESKVLGLSFGTQKVTPGQHVPKAGKFKNTTNATSAPELSFHGAKGTYIVVCLDPDAPFPGFSILGPALHWIQSGLKPENTADGIVKLLEGETPFIVDYAGPGPPPPSSPHRYVFILYEQPEDFDIAKFASPGGKKVGIRPRIRYDLKVFEKEAKLGPVVASSYFFSK
ncbi:putative protease inhibitor [Mollisia scopiformis]|uniref:Putative protease inhibitor n=1 Tax=Mollisia scopiformis TaxID=149040 RepID=A0A194X2X6_MOLSC|nr:putative protease inhibitor [Mollisia scopiformis]KUJ14538.1 putative protease inhibitor [Mollisia scopiformis]